MKKILPPILVTLLITILIFTAGCTNPDTNSNNVAMQQTLDSLTNSISNELEVTGGDLIRTANALSPQEIYLGSDEATAKLNEYYTTHPWVIDVLVVDSGLIVSNAVPEVRRESIGESMSEYTQDRESLKSGKLYLAEVFPLEEGSYGSAMSYPIPPEEGFYYPGELNGARGYVASGFLPAELINAAAPTLLAHTPYTVRVVQPDGTLIYDRDAFQLNKDVSSEVPSEVLTSASGTVEDSVVIDGKTKSRTSIWNTLSIGETSWRIVVMSC